MPVDEQMILCGTVCFMFEEEEAVAIMTDVREHRYWTKKWTQEREESSDCNTTYKLQQELLQVCRVLMADIGRQGIIESIVKINTSLTTLKNKIKKT